MTNKKNETKKVTTTKMSKKASKTEEAVQKYIVLRDKLATFKKAHGIKRGKALKSQIKALDPISRKLYDRLQSEYLAAFHAAQWHMIKE